MKKLTAVFWDVDGTIADTELCGHRQAFNLAFKDYDLNWEWKENEYIELLKVSGGLNRIVHYRDKVNSQISYELCSEIQQRKGFHYKALIESGKIKIRNGVIRLLNELARNDIKQFIVTTSCRESLNSYLNSTLHSHLHLFSKIITFENVSKHKPFPDAYNLAVQLSNNSYENCIAIEDSNIGVEAAKTAHLNVLLTLPPWSSSDQEITKKANACVDSLGDSSKPSKLIYGKPLVSNKIDLDYLTKIIN